MSFTEFIAMGGYGFYVWGSYLASAVVLAAEVVTVRARRARARAAANGAEERR